jgi:hypothetical protein
LTTVEFDLQKGRPGQAAVYSRADFEFDILNPLVFKPMVEFFEQVGFQKPKLMQPSGTGYTCTSKREPLTANGFALSADWAAPPPASTHGPGGGYRRCCLSGIDREWIPAPSRSGVNVLLGRPFFLHADTKLRDGSPDKTGSGQMWSRL